MARMMGVIRRLECDVELMLAQSQTCDAARLSAEWPNHPSNVT